MSEETKAPETSGNQKYEETLKKLMAIISSDKLELPTKVKSTEVGSLVEELFKEESEQNYEKFKTTLKEMLKKHVQLKKEIAKKQEELNKLEKDKQNEFVTACKALFSSIEGIDELTASYAKSLESAIK